MKKIALVLLSIAICVTGCNKLTLKQKLDAYFNALEGRLMCSVIVQQGGKTIYQRSLGYADVEKQITADSLTRYHIGSITKTFTAVCILKAAQEGLLSLNDPLSKFFPEAQIANKEIITVDHLLSHRSGIHDIYSDEESDFNTLNTKPQTREQLIDRIVKAGSDFAPDSASAYSNSGYVLLTFILEKVYQKSYPEIINSIIIKPLSLTNTRYSTPIDPSSGDAYSYSDTALVTSESIGRRLSLPDSAKMLSKWSLIYQTDPSWPLGAGALISTPADLTRFGSAIADGFFGKEITRQMREFNGEFGRGLFDYQQGCYGHGGTIDAFTSSLMIDDSTVVAVCCNTLSMSSPMAKDISRAVYDAAKGGKIEPPSYQSITLTPEQLDPLTGSYKFTNGTEQQILNFVSDGKSLYLKAGIIKVEMYAITPTQFEIKLGNVFITFDTPNKKIIILQDGMSIEGVKVE